MLNYEDILKAITSSKYSSLLILKKSGDVIQLKCSDLKEIGINVDEKTRLVISYENSALAFYEFNTSQDRIGYGDHGTVYKAINLETKEIVAIKYQSSLYQESVPEGWIMAYEKLNKHPYNAKVRNYGVTMGVNENKELAKTGSFILVMELINGSMRNISNLNWTKEQKIETVENFLNLHETLFTERLCHSDFNDSNIMFDTINRLPKLIDFDSVISDSSDTPGYVYAVNVLPYLYSKPISLITEKSAEVIEAEEKVDNCIESFRKYVYKTAQLAFDLKTKRKMISTELKNVIDFCEQQFSIVSSQVHENEEKPTSLNLMPKGMADAAGKFGINKICPTSESTTVEKASLHSLKH